MAGVFIFLLYRLGLALGSPLLLLYLLLRGWRDRRYFRNLRERFGFLPFRATQRGGIWLHAVSVGEVISAVPLIREIKALLPGTPVWVSVTTVAGRELALTRLNGLADAVFHPPLDYAWIVRRVLRHLDPGLVVILETEIWPNLWHETKRRRAGLLIVNGRISGKAFPKYRPFAWAFAPVLACADRILAQSEQDAARYRALLPDGRIEASGNIKYDVLPKAPAAGLRAWLDQQPGPIWIAASTVHAVASDDRDEEDVVIEAFTVLKRKFPGMLLTLAPRKPERFAVAAAKLDAAGIPYVRRSQLEQAPVLPGVLLLDTIGELAGLFAFADAVFVGGSLVHWGGHNILEPAYFARPIIVGPHNENFAEIVADFVAKQALVMAHSAGELADAVERVLLHPDGLGDRARELSLTHRGAAKRAASAALELLDASLPRENGLRWRIPFTWLWRLGNALNRARFGGGAKVPPAVISVGNLTAGGSGKTPLVLWLAKQLKQAAILTRGFRRRSSEPLLLEPGAAPLSVDQTGDEAQSYLRLQRFTVGIGADRVALARRVKQPVVILDDGFQHWRIRRDVNVLVVDAQDPWGGGHVIPRGRLREPFSALRRADVVVLTRTEPKRQYPALLKEIRRHHPRVPILFARTAAVAWHPAGLPPGPYAAFCGLANPGSFRQTLAELGLHAERFLTFPDHHRYHPEDLRGIAEGVSAILTTEKDWVKVKDFGLPVYWLETTVELDRAVQLLDLVKAVISVR